MVRLSIIVPVYNTKQFLRNCIESILKQQIYDYEIILVDDGSDDGSEKICDEYAGEHSNISVIHQMNHGVMDAIQTGVRCSTGEYLTFVDSDDWIGSDTYASVYKNMNKGYDLIVYPIIRFLSENNFHKDQDNSTCRFLTEDDIKKTVFPNMIWNIMEKKFGLDPSLCNKVFKSRLVSKYIKKASKLKGNYGQDVAIIYPFMKEVKSMIFLDSGDYYHRQRIKGEVAPYFRNDNYEKDLYLLYEYLNEEFYGYDEIKKQIDYFYSYSVGLRLRVYGEEYPKWYYVFPFSNIEYGSKVIIYGAGRIGEMYVKQVKKTNDCEIVQWSDKFFDGSKEGLAITTPEKIIESLFDYVVIAINDREIVDDVKNELIALEVDTEKIIWKIDAIKQ